VVARHTREAVGRGSAPDAPHAAKRETLLALVGGGAPTYRDAWKAARKSAKVPASIAARIPAISDW
jgi:hypothetical protein